MTKQYIDTKSVKSNLDSLLSQLTVKEDEIKEKIEYTIRKEFSDSKIDDLYEDLKSSKKTTKAPDNADKNYKIFYIVDEIINEAYDDIIKEKDTMINKVLNSLTKEYVDISEAQTTITKQTANNNYTTRKSNKDKIEEQLQQIIENRKVRQRETTIQNNQSSNDDWFINIDLDDEQSISKNTDDSPFNELFTEQDLNEKQVYNKIDNQLKQGKNNAEIINSLTNEFFSTDTDNMYTHTTEKQTIDDDKIITNLEEQKSDPLAMRIAYQAFVAIISSTISIFTAASANILISETISYGIMIVLFGVLVIGFQSKK